MLIRFLRRDSYGNDNQAPRDRLLAALVAVVWFNETSFSGGWEFN